MSGIFSSMNTATKGLKAQQTALHTTGHNIASMNLEGFSRQRVDMKADLAQNLRGVGQLGTGVKMEGLVRMLDENISSQIRNESSTLNRYAEKSQVLDGLEMVFNEPSETGLNSKLGEVFQAFNDLSKNPESLSSKEVAVEKLKSLTGTLNQMAGQLGRLESESQEAIDKNLLDFNGKAEELSNLNRQIVKVALSGQTPNDLLDQRDLTLKEMSAIGGLELDFDPYGRVEIKMDGKDILNFEGGQNYLAYDKLDQNNPSSTREIKVYDKKTDSEKRENSLGAVDLKNGRIKGQREGLEIIKEASEKLDQLAGSMAKAINRVHQAGGSGNLEIFTFKDGLVGAKNIEVNEAIRNQVDHLKAGKAKEGESEIHSGNGELALELAQLKNKKLDPDGKENPSGSTINSSHIDMVVKIGISKQHSDRMLENQEALTGQLENRRESVSGVSINDEITNVIKFQKAYEANAKVLSVLTEMLDVLINRTGV